MLDSTETTLVKVTNEPLMAPDEELLSSPVLYDQMMWLLLTTFPSRYIDRDLSFISHFKQI